MKLLIFIIILLFVAWILRPLIRIIIGIVKMNRQMRKAMGANGFGKKRESEPSDRYSRQKKYPKNVGEYVSFEEIKVSEEAESNNRTTEERTRVEVESQISDVEFEDIK